MFLNNKFIVLIALISFSSQYSYAENDSDHEVKIEPECSLQAKVLAAGAPLGLLAWAAKELYDAWMQIPTISEPIAAAEDAEKVDDQPRPQNPKKQQKKQKRTSAVVINAGNGGGCMGTVVVPSALNLNDDLAAQVQTTFTVQHDISEDPDVAEILKQKEVKQGAPRKRGKSKQQQTSPKITKQPKMAEPKQKKSTAERVKDCRISLPARSSHQRKKPIFGPVVSVNVEDNQILEGIVDQADENNVVHVVGAWHVNTLKGRYEIEVESQSQEKSQFIQHTLNPEGQRTQSRRVIVYWK